MMATFEVTSRSGRVYQYDLPDNTPDNQALDYGRRMLSDQEQTTLEHDPMFISAQEAKKPTMLERIGRGAMDPLQKAKQLFMHLNPNKTAEEANAYDKQLSDELQTYESGRKIQDLNPITGTMNVEPDAGFDTARLAGNVGMTSFLGLAPIAKQGIARGLGVSGVGGGAGLLQPVDVSKEGFLGKGFWPQTAETTALTAAAGPLADVGATKIIQSMKGVAKPAIEAAGNLISKAKGALPTNAVLDAQGNLTPAGQDALKATGLSWQEMSQDAKDYLTKLSENATQSGQALTPEQQIRAALFKEVTGQEPTLGQLTRSFTQQQTEHDLKKLTETGVPLRGRFAAQNQGMLDTFGRLKSATGAAADNEYQAGQVVAKSINSADQEARGAVGDLYKAVEQEKGGNFGATPNKIISTMEDLRDNAESKPIIDSVLARMKRLGINVQDTNEGFQFENFDKPFTATKAEDLRKFIGGLPANTPGTKRMLGMLTGSLDADVKASAGEDVYNIARSAAKQRFADLEIPAVNKIVNGDVPPEQIYDKFVRKGSIDDLAALKGYMNRGEHDPHGTTAAWNELRSQALEDMFGKSTSQSARDELDNQIFSGARFTKALSALGTEKQKLLFTPDELIQLNKISKVAEWGIPVADVLNTSNTNAAWWNMLDRVLSNEAYIHPGGGQSGHLVRGAMAAVKMGVKSEADKAAVAQALNAPEALAGQQSEAARQASEEATKKGVTFLRVPTFFGVGVERKRKQ